MLNIELPKRKANLKWLYSRTRTQTKKQDLALTPTCFEEDRKTDTGRLLGRTFNVGSLDNTDVSGNGFREDTSVEKITTESLKIKLECDQIIQNLKLTKNVELDRWLKVPNYCFI